MENPKCEQQRYCQIKLAEKFQENPEKVPVYNLNMLSIKSMISGIIKARNYIVFNSLPAWDLSIPPSLHLHSCHDLSWEKHPSLMVCR